MKRSLPRRSRTGAGLIHAAAAGLRYWSFPLIVVVAWMLAVSYTLIILSRRASPVRAGPTIAPPRIAAVQGTPSPR